MDLDLIRARGISRTGKAWITNPVRSMLWRLLVPYVEGMTQEIGEQRRALARLDQMEKTALDLTHRLAGVEQTMGKITPDLTRRLADLKQAMENTTPELTRRLADLEQEAAANARAMAGARKDAMALAHRLAGLEDEAAANGQMPAAAIATASDARSGASVQAANERINHVAYGAPLRAGDRVPIGQDSLVLVGAAGDTRYLVHEHDLIGHNIAAGREWEPHVRAAIESAGRRDGVAVDAGAYIGLHTVTMSRLFSSVHAFEPQRAVYQLLCGNLALNGCLNVAAHNFALYDRPGAMRLAPPERQAVATPMIDGRPDYAQIPNASGLMFEPVDNAAGDVRSAALDNLALNEVALIKIDTEGADLRVLQGAKDTIRRCRPVILFEWHLVLGSQHGASLEDFHAFFADLDYDVVMIHETLRDREADYVATPR